MDDHQIRDKALALEMDIKHNVLKVHCGIFHHQYKPIHSGSAGRSAVWCYYAEKTGNIPTHQNEVQSGMMKSVLLLIY